MQTAPDLTRISKNLAKKVEKGAALCVWGWKSSNHDNFTRLLEKSGLVKFVDLSGSNKRTPLPEQAVVVFTRFVAHRDTNWLRQQNIARHPHPLPLGSVRKILKKIEPALQPKPAPERIQVSTEVLAVSTPRSLTELEKIILEKGHVLDIFDKLTEAFVAKAAQHPQKMVGARTLGEILREIDVSKTPPSLAQAGWIVAHTQPGKKKIGWYKAGPQMERRLQKEVQEEPTDALDKVAWLLKKKPEYEQKLAEAQSQVQYWQDQINRVEAAEELKKQLEAL